MITYSIIQKSQLEGVKRIDAEYYQPEHMVLAEKIRKLQNKSLKQISVIRSGTTPSDRDDALEEGVVLLKTTDIRNNALSCSGNYYHITSKIAERMSKTKLDAKDVLVNIVGATLEVIGRVSFVPDNFPESNITQAMALLRIRDSDYLPEFIFAFLMCKYGKFQTDRLARPTGQFNLNLDELGQVLIPQVLLRQQKDISEIIENVYEIQENSKESYRRAENLFLEELGFRNSKLRDDLSFAVNLSSVRKSNRVDSDFFQPKYQEIIEKIEKYNGGFDLIKNQFKQNKSLSKKDKEFYDYVEISDVNVSNGEIIPNKIARGEIPANGKIVLHRGDLLISKVRPYRGAVSFIDFEAENLLGSGAFTILQEKTDYKKEVLMIFLKLDFIKDLLLRYNCGTSYPVIKDEDILNLQIPLINPDVQEEIVGLVKMSHEARKKSKELLEEAKRKIEEMIEKGSEN